MHHGVGEDELAVGGQSAHVVRVEVGDQDVVDLFRLVAGRLQIVDQLAQRRAEQRAAAGVDQHQPLAGVDQEGVGRGGGRRAQVGLGQRRLRGGLIVVQQVDHRQVGGAVVQRRDFDVADHHPRIAGRGQGRQRRGRLRLRQGQAAQGRQQRLAQRGGLEELFHGVPFDQVWTETVFHCQPGIASAISQTTP
ncbi:conserved hypothetical protein [Ricinus communis]|uniref:Uncharacterized protein n=1 Tax=Ricinus communis TaxID=3988 RepID=B9TIK1_RICCO|nr:conserved hypothetical protein [Ricinus communis]